MFVVALELDERIDPAAVATVRATISRLDGPPFPEFAAPSSEGGSRLESAGGRLTVTWTAPAAREVAVGLRLGNAEPWTLHLAGTALGAEKASLASGEGDAVVPVGGAGEVVLALECGPEVCASTADGGIDAGDAGPGAELGLHGGALVAGGGAGGGAGGELRLSGELGHFVGTPPMRSGDGTIELEGAFAVTR